MDHKQDPSTDKATSSHSADEPDHAAHEFLSASPEKAGATDTSISDMLIPIKYKIPESALVATELGESSEFIDTLNGFIYPYTDTTKSNTALKIITQRTSVLKRFHKKEAPNLLKRLKRFEDKFEAVAEDTEKNVDDLGKGSEYRFQLLISDADRKIASLGRSFQTVLRQYYGDDWI